MRNELTIGSVTVYVFTGDDGVPVIQVDTLEDTGRVRVNVNDAPVFDADPETNIGPMPSSHDCQRYAADGDYCEICGRMAAR